MTGKRWRKSKLNWIGVGIVLCGAISDPTVQGYLGELVPKPWLGKIVAVAGLAVIVIRTCCTNQPITRKPAEDPRDE